MLKEVHSLIDGLKIKDEAIKVRLFTKLLIDIICFRPVRTYLKFSLTQGLQEECTRRLDKIQILQRSIQMLQDQITQNTQHHNTVSIEKDNLITQLQHSLKESEDTVQVIYLFDKTYFFLFAEFYFY